MQFFIIHYTHILLVLLSGLKGYGQDYTQLFSCNNLVALHFVHTVVLEQVSQSFGQASQF